VRLADFAYAGNHMIPAGGEANLRSSEPLALLRHLATP
jgi:hypothetical protein